VTVLFADVVHSMDIATAVGSERLHLDRCTAAEVVARLSATLLRLGGKLSRTRPCTGLGWR
jgi:class 3 adenylate cyclase